MANPNAKLTPRNSEKHLAALFSVVSLKSCWLGYLTYTTVLWGSLSHGTALVGIFVTCHSVVGISVTCHSVGGDLCHTPQCCGNSVTRHSVVGTSVTCHSIVRTSITHHSGILKISFFHLIFHNTHLTAATLISWELAPRCGPSTSIDYNCCSLSVWMQNDWLLQARVASTPLP